MQTDSQELPELPQRKSNSPEQITHDRVLLVEGRDETNFFAAMLKHVGLDQRMQIIEIGGKDKFLEGFPAFLNLPGFDQVHAYGIIRDADANHSSTFESIKGLLERHGQPCQQHWLSSAKRILAF